MELKPNFFLEGLWKGFGEVTGKQNFNFEEEISVEVLKHPVYSIRSKITAVREGALTILHQEQGFFKLLEENKIDLSLSHSFNICELSCGKYKENEIILESINIARHASSLQNPFCSNVKRKYWLNEAGALEYELEMVAIDSSIHYQSAKLKNQTLKIFWHPYSEPSRAVVGFIKQLNIPAQIIFVDILKNDQLSGKMLEINPKGQLPCIQDAEFKLAESSAILKYLCKTRTVPEHWYPKDIQKQSRTNEFLDWYHSTLRRNCFQYVMGKHYAKQINQTPPSEDQLKKLEKDVLSNLQSIENNYLQEYDFLIGNEVTIADLIGVSEIFTLVLVDIDFDNFPKISQWIKNTFKLAGYKEAFVSFIKYCEEHNPEGVKEFR